MKHSVALFLLSLFILSSPAQAKLFYVGSGGDDSNSGLSWTQRRLTLSGMDALEQADPTNTDPDSLMHGDTLCFLAGDTVIGLNEGEYFGTSLLLRPVDLPEMSNGTMSSKHAVISYPGTGASTNLLAFKGSSVRAFVENMVFYGGPAADPYHASYGIFGEDQAELRLTGCKIFSCNSGLSLNTGSTATAENCEFGENQHFGVRINAAEFSAKGCRSFGNVYYGYYVTNHGSLVLEDCITEENSRHGVEVANGASGLFTRLLSRRNSEYGVRSTNADTIALRLSRVEENNLGGLISSVDGDTVSITIKGTTFLSTSGSGTGLYHKGSQSVSVHSTLFYGDFTYAVYNAGTGSIIANHLTIDGPARGVFNDGIGAIQLDDSIISNCGIIAAQNSYPGTLDLAYLLFYGNPSDTIGVTGQESLFHYDPLFLNPWSGDFRLRWFSPALHASQNGNAIGAFGPDESATPSWGREPWIRPGW